MYRIYKFETGMDCSITLKIDDSVLTEALAKDMVSFWSGGDEVLDASDGDIFEAIGRFAAARLFAYLLDGYHEKGAVSVLHEQEGYAIKGDSLGIEIIDHEIPEFDPAYFEVTKL